MGTIRTRRVGKQHCAATISRTQVMSLPEAHTPMTLREMITFLAAVDDEDDAVGVVPILIPRRARLELARCDAVSLTYGGDEDSTTLEADFELVRAIDEAQDPDADGPCPP